MYRCAAVAVLLAILLPVVAAANAHRIDSIELPPPQAFASAQWGEFELLSEVALHFGTGITDLSNENAAILEQHLFDASERLTPAQSWDELVIVINGAADSVRTVIQPQVLDTKKRQRPANTSFADARASSVYDYFVSSKCGATLSLEGSLVSGEHAKYPAACFVRFYRRIPAIRSVSVCVVDTILPYESPPFLIGASGGWMIVGPHSGPFLSLDGAFARWHARIAQAGSAEERGEHEIYFGALDYAVLRSSNAEVAFGLLGFRAWEFAEDRHFTERRSGALVWSNCRFYDGPLRLELGGGFGLARFTDGYSLTSSTEAVAGASLSASLLFDLFR